MRDFSNFANYNGLKQTSEIQVEIDRPPPCGKVDIYALRLLLIFTGFSLKPICQRVH